MFGSLVLVVDDNWRTCGTRSNKDRSSVPKCWVEVRGIPSRVDLLGVFRRCVRRLRIASVGGFEPDWQALASCRYSLRSSFAVQGVYGTCRHLGYCCVGGRRDETVY